MMLADPSGDNGQCIWASRVDRQHGWDPHAQRQNSFYRRGEEDDTPELGGEEVQISGETASDKQGVEI